MFTTVHLESETHLRCSRCKQLRKDECFHFRGANKERRRGRDYYCKDCVREQRGQQPIRRRKTMQNRLWMECLRCTKMLPREHFYYDRGKQRYFSHCRDCQNLIHAKSVLKLMKEEGYREHIRELNSKYRKKEQDKRKLHRAQLIETLVHYLGLIQARGYTTCKEVSILLGVPYCTVRAWLKQEAYPRGKRLEPMVLHVLSVLNSLPKEKSHG
jgi:hypothetical protein